MSTDVTLDLNAFYDVAREDLASLLASAAVGSSIIFNNSGKTVDFYVYNYIDTVYWIAAQQTKVADQYTGAVACSGTQFKINPDKKKEDQFIVEPGKAYVYHGPGKVETVA